MSPVLNLLRESMEVHLTNRNKPGMTKTKARRMEKVRIKMNGIIIVQPINIKTLLRMGKDCHMRVICRRLSRSEIPRLARDTSVNTFCNLEYT